MYIEAAISTIRFLRTEFINNSALYDGGGTYYISMNPSLTERSVRLSLADVNYTSNTA